jgi:putative membrane protein
MMWGDWDGWSGHMSGWGWVWMIGSTVLFWALIGTLAVLVVRALNRRTDAHPAPSRDAAERVLAERFARGDIDEDEYRSRLAVLRSEDLAQSP